MSGCKTVSKINDVDESHIVTEISDTLSNDTVAEENIIIDTVEIDTVLIGTVLIENNDTVIVDTAMKNDTVITVALETKKTLPQKESFVDDKIERTCNDSTIQDFRNNKIYYYGQAKVVYEDITIEEFLDTIKGEVINVRQIKSRRIKVIDIAENEIDVWNDTEKRLGPFPRRICSLVWKTHQK